MLGECNFLSSVLPQQKFEVTAGQCYSSILLASKGKYILKVQGQADPKDEKGREAPNFGSSFYMFFLLPLSLSYVIGLARRAVFFLT